MLRFVARAACVAVVLLHAVARLEASDSPLVPATPALPVRLAPAYYERWLAPGLCRSATLRELVTELSASDVIVYVVPRYKPSRRIAGDLQFVVASPTSRILRVTLNLRAVGHAADAAIAMLGHELRHAVEIARDPDIRSAEAFASYYREHGTETDWGVFDTAAARAAEREVRDQLLRDSNSCTEDADLLDTER